LVGSCLVVARALPVPASCPVEVARAVEVVSLDVRLLVGSCLVVAVIVLVSHCSSFRTLLARSLPHKTGQALEIFPASLQFRKAGGDAPAVQAILQRIRQSGGAIAAVARNPDLRRLEIGWAFSIVAHWAYLVAVSVYAYNAGGAAAVGL